MGQAPAQVGFADVRVAPGDQDALLEGLAPHVFMNQGLADEVLAVAACTL